LVITFWFKSAFTEQSADGNTGEISYMISTGVPVGRPSQIELRNMHGTYAVTWWVSESHYGLPLTFGNLLY
jgi:cytochrome oxidase assembly protein ShyY1